MAAACAAPAPPDAGAPATPSATLTPAAPSPGVSPAPSATASPAAPAPDGRFSVRGALRHVRRLADGIGPRPAGSPAYRAAVRYVREMLDGLGYRVRAQRFELPAGGPSWNVEGRWPGSEPPRVVIGAHLDTVPGSPGGNDNASGVAVMLELARVVAGSEEARGLRLVAFGAEERQPVGGGHIGSEAYVAALAPAEREGIRAMVSVDMIGKARPIVIGWFGDGSRSAVAALRRGARAEDVAVQPMPVADVSDHGPFGLAGIPAALLWTGFEPNYHAPGDVAANVDPPALRDAGRLLLALLRGRA